MRRNVMVWVWMGLAATAWSGCAASSGAYPPASMAMQASGPPPAPSMEATASVSSVSSVEEGASTGESERVDVAEQPAPQAQAPAPQAPGRAAPTRNLPGVTQATGPAGNTGQPAQPAQPAAATPATPAAMLIYTAEIELQTAREAVTPTIDRVIEAATAMGGYLLRRTDTSVQVRVPSARFRESLRTVEEFGEVLHRSVAAQDVSEEYRDLEVRLQNLRAVRRRLEEFLARAGSMADALQVERELERVTREIDTIEGRLRFLGARVAFSLVTVNVRARPEGVMVAGPPIPPRRAIDLPVEWFRRVGLERLLDTRE